MSYLYVFLGGGLGACARFALSSYITTSWSPEKFPLGVIVCNIVGSFLMGLAFSYNQSHTWFPPLIMVGFLGGFTTFSSFSLEAYKLYDAGAITHTLIYILTSFIGSVLALFAAIKIIR